MQVTFFSDTHRNHDKVIMPKSDITVFCGDFSSEGSYKDTLSFLEWYNKIEGPKVMIAGNHDISFDEKMTHCRMEIKNLLKNFPDITYLENSSIEINGCKIWGSPITPWFYGDYWAFNKHRGSDIYAIWKEIPLDTDILVTHGPPMYMLDKTKDGMNVGCGDLYNKVMEIKPKIHAFGHIHEGYGQQEHEGVIFVNASCSDFHYNPINKPITITL